MTSTPSLIDQLASEGAPRTASLSRGFLLPLLATVALCAVGIALVLDGAFAPVAAYGIMPLTVKWGFAVALLLMSVTAMWLLGQPGRRSSDIVSVLAIPFVLVGLLLAIDLSVAQPPFPGATWRTCLAAMAILSPIGFTGAIIATRWLAPTKLHRAGMTAGMFGGALAMLVYSPYCPELGMAYLATFYCLPILVMAGLGWILGPRLLRW